MILAMVKSEQQAARLQLEREKLEFQREKHRAKEARETVSSTRTIPTPTQSPAKTCITPSPEPSPVKQPATQPPSPPQKRPPLSIQEMNPGVSVLPRPNDLQIAQAAALRDFEKLP